MSSFQIEFIMIDAPSKKKKTDTLFYRVKHSPLSANGTSKFTLNLMIFRLFTLLFTYSISIIYNVFVFKYIKNTQVPHIRYSQSVPGAYHILLK